MSEHGQLTGSSERGYTGRMSESAVAVLDGPPTIETPVAEADMTTRQPLFELPQRQQTALAKLETEIMAEHSETPLAIPEHVTRKEKSWKKFGWENSDKEEVSLRLKDVLGLEGDQIKNTLEILLASGKSPDEILRHFQSDEAFQKLRKEIRENKNRRAHGELTAEEEATARIYYLNDVTHISDEEKARDPRKKKIKGISSEKQNEYLQRFVFTEAYRDHLYSDYQRTRPADLYDLAWQISFSDKVHEKNFGVNGEYPILEMRVDTDGGQVTGGRYVVNQANFIRWMRERIVHWQEQTPDDYVDYFQKVQLKKDLGSLSLGEILNDHTLYFTDETGTYFEGLAKQALIEPWILATVREYHFKYFYNMSSEKKLVETYGEMFAMNKLTKKTFGKSMMYYFATLPVDFDPNGTDATMGAAFNTMLLAYYNFSDQEKLEEVLGKDSSFFTREGMTKAIREQMAKRFGNTAALSEQLGTFLGEKYGDFEKAFTDKAGNKVNKIQDKKAFSAFVNYLAVMAPDANWKDVVKQALKNAIAEQYDFSSDEGNTDSKKQKIDKYSLEVAALIAESHTLFTGAGAKNDTGAAGFNGLSKLMNGRVYRLKMITESRGNGAGNPFTVHQFKMFAVDFLRAIRVSEAQTEDRTGNKVVTRNKTPLEVMEELRTIETTREATRQKIQSDLEEAKKVDNTELAAQKERELVSLTEVADEAYKRVAAQLEFKENTMVNYVANFLNRGRSFYEQVMSAENIDFEKFTKFDPITHTATFDRAPFQKKIQEDFNKQLRYFVATYGELNLAMPIRTAVYLGRDGEKDKWEYRTIPLGEAMFGYEMLNIPEFRKYAARLDSDGKPMRDEKGNIVESDNWEIKNGRYVIDWSKVDADKTLVWKQVALMKIGADLWSHIDKHSKDSKYTVPYFRSVLAAIDSIPANIDGNETDMKGTLITGTLFSKEQMKWFKELTKTTDFQLFLRSLGYDLWKKKAEGGFSDSVTMILRAVASGY